MPPFAKHLWYATYFLCDDWAVCLHGFQRWKAKPFVGGGEYKCSGCLVGMGQLLIG